MPDYFGHWHRIYVRYNRWCHKGTWSRLLNAVSDDPDFEYLMVDGSIVRVDQHGLPKKTQAEEAQGKSWGGLSAKIHAAVDALGNPARFILTLR